MNKLQTQLMTAVARAILPTTPLEVLGLASLDRDEALELAEQMGKANDAEIDRRFLERGGDLADRFGNVAPIFEAGGAMFSNRGGDE